MVGLPPHRRQGGVGPVCTVDGGRLQFTLPFEPRALVVEGHKITATAASKLRPACDDLGFDPFRSSCQKAGQGTNPSNYR
jgi:hypothetical protein